MGRKGRKTLSLESSKRRAREGRGARRGEVSELDRGVPARTTLVAKPDPDSAPAEWTPLVALVRFPGDAKALLLAAGFGVAMASWPAPRTSAQREASPRASFELVRAPPTRSARAGPSEGKRKP
jgi:hypothetical protein